ncbi:hypothetical protein MLD38_005557 [Melastoma candidum]|uniref:Uncharacterized protein n=1 Tax=Melastoma candidum TaxID=119954 RepID=A0ACB9RP76_9MYRT|nr:hypothetical protein MLD38_005557 [Melastoma candidum]
MGSEEGVGTAVEVGVESRRERGREGVLALTVCNEGEHVVGAELVTELKSTEVELEVKGEIVGRGDGFWLGSESNVEKKKDGMGPNIKLGLSWGMRPVSLSGQGDTIADGTEEEDEIEEGMGDDGPREGKKKLPTDPSCKCWLCVEVLTVCRCWLCVEVLTVGNETLWSAARFTVTAKIGRDRANMETHKILVGNRHP